MKSRKEYRGMLWQGGIPMTLEIKIYKTLGDFLKSRRERIQPEEAGILGSYGRRRTPGLRREEVAQLAGVSTTWYTWLEQGRHVSASREVIESIGRALQLSSDEQHHLLRLSHYSEPKNPSNQSEIMDTGLQRIIDHMPYPAIIANNRTEVLAWNKMASKIIANFDEIPSEERNMTRLIFLNPFLRKNLLNWNEFAQFSVAVFRSNFDQQPGDPWFEAFVRKICKESKEFSDLWQLHDVQRKTARKLTFNHPEEGIVSFQLNSFGHINGNADLHCCVFTPLSD